MHQSGEGIRAGEAVSHFLQLIRFSHTIFALPFALGALIVAANGWPSLRILVLVVVCMVFARTAAMLFNRLIDWSLDQRNPRTVSRPRAGYRTHWRMDRASWSDRSCPSCARGGCNLLGRRVRSHLCDAGLRFRSARRYSIACCEAWNRAKPSSGAVIASFDICGAH